ncbi:hypothetical protein AYO49_06025 [Verrucomicrobiaceae bacterium SCGC AG-212-N21]|nr:hypothetical protein AYO49_06025 [Verrucomicrobiaceae bacterium SCGC AG-212-N21]
MKRVCLATLMASLLLPWGMPVSAEGADEAAPTREQIEKDLELRATLTTPATITAGDAVNVSLTLHNRSQQTTHAVVLPSDGSESGWREPHIFYSATVDQGTGKAAPIEPTRFARCGLYDFNWHKDIRQLKPGEELKLGEWVPQPSMQFEFQEAGRVKLQAHYRFRAGATKDPNLLNPGTSAMTGVPAFELVSKSMELVVEKPLNVVLRAKSPLVAGKTNSLRDLFDVRLVNQSKDTLEIPEPHPALVSFQVECKHPDSRPELLALKGRFTGTLRLEPGEEVALIGEGPRPVGIDGMWEYPRAETIRVRAMYLGSLNKRPYTIYSKWVEVEVR